MALETVFLDAGGVLVFPNWVRVSEALEAHGVLVEPETLALADAHAKKALDAGETITGTTDHQRSWPYFNLLLKHAGVEQNVDTDAALAELHVYHAKHNLWETVSPDVVPALVALRAAGFRLVVISNANGRLHACFDRVGLSTRLDLVLDSFHEGVEKPDPRLFQIGLARAGATAATTIHIGDIYHVDVVGARNASIQPVLLDPHGLYRDADCARVASLGELVEGIRAGSITTTS